MGLHIIGIILNYYDGVMAMVNQDLIVDRLRCFNRMIDRIIVIIVI